jgi:di/tricarboxylate transporter
MGYGKAISMTFAGISSSGAILVGAALFLAAAMMSTGLDKRIALGILSKVGSKTNRIVAGMIFIGFVLAFFVPSTTARVGCIVPIVLRYHCRIRYEKQQPFCSTAHDCYGARSQHLEHRY